MSGRRAVRPPTASVSVASSASVFRKEGMSPVTASPQSWTMHMSSTFPMSRSGNSSRSRKAIEHSR